jgi:hypothetical protein
MVTVDTHEPSNRSARRRRASASTSSMPPCAVICCCSVSDCARNNVAERTTTKVMNVSNVAFLKVIAFPPDLVKVQAKQRAIASPRGLALK